jgi:hypothetical protein
MIRSRVRESFTSPALFSREIYEQACHEEFSRSFLEIPDLERFVFLPELLSASAQLFVPRDDS